jgi:hypothetical protein
MHSYWDDFWALQGYEDAVRLAGVLGLAADARRIGESRDTFRRDFSASIAAAMKKHGIGWVPGCADLGDFDATSTTMALSPTQSEDVPPKNALSTTFYRYLEYFEGRREGEEKWEAFTPYEMRNIGAFVRLGWRERAHLLMDWFLTQRTPPGWAEWAEVVYNAPTSAKFIGDLPHTWVGSDFVRSVLDMFAYERDSDSSLVIAAGVPAAWASEAQGVSVKRLSTAYGALSFTMRAERGELVMRMEKGTRIPRGGIVVVPPAPSRGAGGLSNARVNGVRAVADPHESVTIRRLPAEVRWKITRTGPPMNR